MEDRVSLRTQPHLRSQRREQAKEAERQAWAETRVWRPRSWKQGCQELQRGKRGPCGQRPRRGHAGPLDAAIKVIDHLGHKVSTVC